MTFVARAPTMQTSVEELSAVESSNHSVSSALRPTSSGKPLDPDTRTYMESRFSHDFSEVRIHTDSASAKKAESVSARAYTLGSDIVFNNGEYSAKTYLGKKLLAHELTHVVQQLRGGSPPPLDPTSPHERVAKSTAQEVVSGSTVPVEVVGSTGIGIAADWKNWIKSKASTLKNEAEDWAEGTVEEYVPEEVQKFVEDVAEAADDLNSILPSPEVSKTVGSGIVEYATQKDTDGNSPKEEIHDQAMEAIGIVKGVVVQGTDLADTLVWASNEAQNLKDKMVRHVAKVASVDEKMAVDASEALLNLTSMSIASDLAQLGDLMVHAGLVDENGQPSLTTVFSENYNDMASYVEEALGPGVPRDDSFFTPMEIGELKGAIGSQIALSSVGVTEVKVALDVVGAISGLRAVVESVRSDPNWKTNSYFWSGVIGMVLSIVGLRHTLAAKKITQLVLKYDWVAGAIPPMAAMINTYYDESLSEEGRERRMKQHWMQVIHVLKDAVMHVTQTTISSKPQPQKGSLTNEGTSPAVQQSKILPQSQGVHLLKSPQAPAVHRAKTAPQKNQTTNRKRTFDPNIQPKNDNIIPPSEPLQAAGTEGPIGPQRQYPPKLKLIKGGQVRRKSQPIRASNGSRARWKKTPSTGDQTQQPVKDTPSIKPKIRLPANSESSLSSPKNNKSVKPKINSEDPSIQAQSILGNKDKKAKPLENHSKNQTESGLEVPDEMIKQAQEAQAIIIQNRAKEFLDEALGYSPNKNTKKPSSKTAVDEVIVLAADGLPHKNANKVHATRAKSSVRTATKSKESNIPTIKRKKPTAKSEAEADLDSILENVDMEKTNKVGDAYEAEKVAAAQKQIKEAQNRAGTADKQIKPLEKSEKQRQPTKRPLSVATSSAGKSEYHTVPSVSVQKRRSSLPKDKPRKIEKPEVGESKRSNFDSKKKKDQKAVIAESQLDQTPKSSNFRDLGRRILREKNVVSISQVDTIVGRNNKSSWDRSTATATHRKDVAAHIKSDDDHVLSFLLDDKGKLKQTTKKGMDEVTLREDPTLVESGHKVSSKAVGPGGEEILVLQSAHKNRTLAAIAEHPKKGGHVVDDELVLDIGGVAVDKDLALDWLDAGLINLDTFRNAKLIRID